MINYIHRAASLIRNNIVMRISNGNRNLIRIACCNIIILYIICVHSDPADISYSHNFSSTSTTVMTDVCEYTIIHIFL